MGQSLTGSFARTYQGLVPYTDARRWGNGINPVHSQYAGPPRPFGPGVPNDLDQRTHPSMASPDSIEMGPPWGAPEDPSYLDSVANQADAVEGVIPDQDDFPSWEEVTTSTRAEVEPGMANPWGVRGIPSGLHHEDAGPNFGDFGGGGQEGSALPQVPTETVNEGWLNKSRTGPAEEESDPADDSQVFVQTSMTQRHKELENVRAQDRGTDPARTSIPSRVTSQKVKYFSGGMRHYDMFPYQIDQIPRPFRYRTAALGPAPYLRPNEMRLISPLQRVVPPDPSMGQPSNVVGDGDGYTSEDQGWY
jgi:hypothetical protein